MLRILIAAVLAALIAAPAAGQTRAKKPAKKPTTTTATWMTAEDKARATGYSPSGNPQWDVYVRGEYVGSDPDPRIRSTIRSEGVRNYNALSD